MTPRTKTGAVRIAVIPALMLLLAAPAASQTLEGSRWTGGLTNTSYDSTCYAFGAHRIRDGSGWEIEAEIHAERLKGVLKAKPGNDNKHRYQVSALVGPGRRLERGTILIGPYIAKFSGDIVGDRFEARWELVAAGDVDCFGKVFMTMVK